MRGRHAILRSAVLALSLAVMTGCASGRNLSADLPDLPPPPRQPAERQIPMPVSPEVALFDTEGTALPRTISTKKDFRVEVTFRMPEDVHPKDVGVIAVGLLWPKKSGEYAFADMAGGRPKRDSHGKYRVNLELTTPPVAGNCVVCALFKNRKLVEIPLDVR